MTPQQGLEIMVSPLKDDAKAVIDMSKFLRKLIIRLDEIYGAGEGVQYLNLITELIAARAEGTNPDVTALAAALGVSRSTLRRKCSRLRCSVPEFPEFSTKGRHTQLEYKELDAKAQSAIQWMVNNWPGWSERVAVHRIFVEQC